MCVCVCLASCGPPSHHICCFRPVFQILEKNKKVTKFLNRMLAMSLRDQKLLFTYFSDTLVRPLADPRLQPCWTSLLPCSLLALLWLSACISGCC